jgi:hypothetical protein
MRDFVGIHETPFPFFREPFVPPPKSGLARYADYPDGSRWRIGCERIEEDFVATLERHRRGDHSDGDTYLADGVGVQIVDVISVVSPGRRYADRVFYVRRWRDPDGIEFGAAILRFGTVTRIENMIRGFRKPYTVTAPIGTAA